MLIKHEIKNWKDGSVLFSYEKEGNTISETVQKFFDENKGKTISFADFSFMDLSAVTFDKCKFDKCKFDYCTFDKCKLDEITMITFSNSLDSIRFDFFGRMLVLKDEVKFLKQSLIDGLIDGSQYEGECCCFIGTAAKSKQVKYNQIEGIKPDSNSNTERWFMGIKKGDTPQNSTIAKITLEWIEEFERLIAK